MANSAILSGFLFPAFAGTSLTGMTGRERPFPAEGIGTDEEWYVKNVDSIGSGGYGIAEIGLWALLLVCNLFMVLLL